MRGAHASSVAESSAIFKTGPRNSRPTLLGRGRNATHGAAGRKAVMSMNSEHCRRPTAASECQESLDCGDRPNRANDVHRGGVYETARLAGWANCNLYYRDGCETHSVDCRCEGDESVVSEPLASIICQPGSSLAEPYDCTRMSPLKAAADEALGECYLRITREQPHATVVLLESGSSNAALHACAREATTTLRPLPTESVTTYAIRAVFTSE